MLKVSFFFVPVRREDDLKPQAGKDRSASGRKHCLESRRV